MPIAENPVIDFAFHHHMILIESYIYGAIKPCGQAKDINPKLQRQIRRWNRLSQHRADKGAKTQQH
jgi:hypothetical protein